MAINFLMIRVYCPADHSIQPMYFRTLVVSGKSYYPLCLGCDQSNGSKICSACKRAVNALMTSEKYKLHDVNSLHLDDPQ